MVCAILADSKTKTRRVIKPTRLYRWLDIDAGTVVNPGGHKIHISELSCPYGQIAVEFSNYSASLRSPKVDSNASF